MTTAQTLSQYLSTYEGTVAAKPVDAAIGSQQAMVAPDGTVAIVFSSNDTAKVQALRDWLTTILGS